MNRLSTGAAPSNAARAAMAVVTMALALAVVIDGAAPVRAAEPTDTTAPTIVDAGLVTGAVVDGDVVVRPVVSDDVAVTRVELLADGYLQVRTDAAPWTLDWNTRRFADEDLDLQLVAYDAAGNRTAAMVYVRADNFAPITGFRLNNQTVKGVTPLEFMAPDSDLARIDVRVGTKLIGTATAAPWKIMWNTTAYRGPVKLTARLSDTFGNARTIDNVVIVDYAGPRMTLNTPYTVPGFINSRDTIYANLSDVSGIARVELLINGRRIRSVTNGSSYVELPFDPRIKNGTTVTVTVRAYDGLGNVTVHTRRVLVDNVDPVVVMTPGNSKLVRGTFSASVVSVRDGSGIAQVTTTFGGRRVEDTRAPFTTVVNSRLVPDGTRLLSWYITDRAGNGMFVDRRVKVDNRAPTVRFDRAPGNKAKVKGTVKITAAANDYYGVHRVELLLNGKVVQTDRVRGFSFTVNPKRYGRTMTVQLRAVDNAGNATLSARRTWSR